MLRFTPPLLTLLALTACGDAIPEQIQGRWTLDTQALFASRLAHLAPDERREAEALVPELLRPLTVIITSESFELQTARRHVKGPCHCTLIEQGWLLKAKDGGSGELLVRPVEGGGLRLDFEGRHLLLRRQE
ncbi:hypothetical protein KKF91_02830 [Myxococcota bacterium]|nr:hypothetical protein [Myxococcota bacterium]MBU1429474.1 hypothetical protein [Myxococcota bacterium]MBU1896150.1 hypothetical protein [Myxococcota bacterium]